MSLHESDFQIYITSWRAYCDVCGRTFEPSFFQSAQLNIVRSSQTQQMMYNQGLPYETVPPITREMILSEMKTANWRTESRYGKEFVVCGQHPPEGMGSKLSGPWFGTDPALQRANDPVSQPASQGGEEPQNKEKI